MLKRILLIFYVVIPYGVRAARRDRANASPYVIRDTKKVFVT